MTEMQPQSSYSGQYVLYVMQVSKQRHKVISYIHGIEVDHDQVITVFGMIPLDKHFTILQMNAIAFLILMAQTLILMQLK